MAKSPLDVLWFWHVLNVTWSVPFMHFGQMLMELERRFRAGCLKINSSKRWISGVSHLILIQADTSTTLDATTHLHTWEIYSSQLVYQPACLWDVGRIWSNQGKLLWKRWKFHKKAGLSLDCWLCEAVALLAVLPNELLDSRGVQGCMIWCGRSYCLQMGIREWFCYQELLYWIFNGNQPRRCGHSEFEYHYHLIL